MNQWRRIAEYLHTDVLSLIEAVERNPNYQVIVARAIEAITAEIEANEDAKLGRG